jgi:hypothetical protein
MTDLMFGKKDPLDKPALRLSSILTGVVPDHPPAVDHLALGGWQMLGNDRWGDCVAVTWANVRRLLTLLGGAEKYPGLEQVLQVYKTQNPAFPNQDDGMYIQALLELLVGMGGPDGAKPLAFAEVDYHSEAEVQAAISIFGYLWVGFSVQSRNMSEDFPNKPFDYRPSDHSIGGHSVIVGGYDSDHSGYDEIMATWARESGFTENGWANLVDEAWVVIWPEHLGTAQFQQGVDKDKLAAAFKALTGRDLPIPVGPLPNVVVDPADVEFAPPLKSYINSKPKWARFTKSGKLVAAGKRWLEQKGI